MEFAFRDFEILDILYRSSSGSVYLARHRRLKKKFVLKERKTSELGNGRSAFHEADILKKIATGCENIISFEGQFVDNERRTFFLVLEYAEGGDLSAFIQKRKMKRERLPEKRIWELFLGLMNGMVHFHRKRVIHRDIKSLNVFLSSDERVLKIGDFGVSRVLKDEESMAETVMGTPLYMSPEICAGDVHSFSTDLWSAGVILYEITTLTVPFTGRTFAEVAARIRMGRYENISVHRPDLDFATIQRLQSTIDKLLHLSPQQRPSAEKVKQQIEWFLTSLNIPGVSRRHRSSNSDKERQKRRNDKSHVLEMRSTETSSTDDDSDWTEAEATNGRRNDSYALTENSRGTEGQKASDRFRNTNKVKEKGLSKTVSNDSEAVRKAKDRIAMLLRATTEGCDNEKYTTSIGDQEKFDMMYVKPLTSSKINMERSSHSIEAQSGNPVAGQSRSSISQEAECTHEHHRSNSGCENAMTSKSELKAKQTELSLRDQRYEARRQVIMARLHRDRRAEEIAVAQNRADSHDALEAGRAAEDIRIMRGFQREKSVGVLDLKAQSDKATVWPEQDNAEREAQPTRRVVRKPSVDEKPYDDGMYGNGGLFAGLGSAAAQLRRLELEHERRWNDVIDLKAPEEEKRPMHGACPASAVKLNEKLRPTGPTCERSAPLLPHRRFQTLLAWE